MLDVLSVSTCLGFAGVAQLKPLSSFRPDQLKGNSEQGLPSHLMYGSC